MTTDLGVAALRGEVDFRTHGVITGTIWLAGRATPLRLDLTGWPAADLAGCQLSFWNEEARDADTSFLESEQPGEAGLMTASARFRISTLSQDEEMERSRLGLPVAARTVNGVLLEWFNPASGHVRITGTLFRIAVTEPLWRLTRKDQVLQRRRQQASMEKYDPDHSHGILLSEADFQSAASVRPAGEEEIDTLLHLLEKYGNDPHAWEKALHDLEQIGGPDLSVEALAQAHALFAAAGEQTDSPFLGEFLEFVLDLNEAHPFGTDQPAFAEFVTESQLAAAAFSRSLSRHQSGTDLSAQKNRLLSKACLHLDKAALALQEIKPVTLSETQWLEQAARRFATLSASARRLNPPS